MSWLSRFQPLQPGYSCLSHLMPPNIHPWPPYWSYHRSHVSGEESNEFKQLRKTDGFNIEKEKNLETHMYVHLQARTSMHTHTKKSLAYLSFRNIFFQLTWMLTFCSVTLNQDELKWMPLTLWDHRPLPLRSLKWWSSMKHLQPNHATPSAPCTRHSLEWTSISFLKSRGFQQ